VARIARPGDDVTVITYGPQVAVAQAAAETMAAEGVGVQVIDLRTIVPWDRETVLNAVAKTGRAVVTHEAVKAFGVGAEISSVIHEELFSDLKAAVQRVGAPSCAVPYSNPLEKAFVPDADKVLAAIRKTLN